MRSRQLRFGLYGHADALGRSSIFDLLGGDDETRQTKALGYVLAECPDLLDRLLRLPAVRLSIERTGVQAGLRRCDTVLVEAEEFSEGARLRRDLAIRFVENGATRLLVVIEAKSARGGDTRTIAAQLEGYFDPRLYPADANVPAVGIALTRYPMVLPESQRALVALAWRDVIEAVGELRDSLGDARDARILEDFTRFLAGATHGMRFFEKEVLSIPAGDSLPLIERHSVHACPHMRKDTSTATPCS